MSYPPYPNMAVPYRGHIESGLIVGRMIRIRGTVNPAAQRFAINLQCGPNTKPRDDIALHFSPQFNTNGVMCNSLISNKWGPGVILGHFPFAPGQEFEVIILCEATHFKIAVNGQHCIEYAHYIPYKRINHITIDGDIVLSSVMFEDPPLQEYPGIIPPPPTYIAPLPPQEDYYTPTDYVSQPAYFSNSTSPIVYVSQPPFISQQSYVDSSHTTYPSGGGFMKYGAAAAAGAAVGGLGGYALSNVLYSSSSDSD